MAMPAAPDFDALTPEAVLEAVESALALRLEPLTQPLPSYVDSSRTMATRWASTATSSSPSIRSAAVAPSTATPTRPSIPSTRARCG